MALPLKTPSTSAGSLPSGASKLTANSTSSAASVIPHGADHDVCVRHLALRDAIHRFDEKKLKIIGVKGEEKFEGSDESYEDEDDDEDLRRSLLNERVHGGEASDTLRRRLGCKWVNWKKQNVCDGRIKSNDHVVTKTAEKGGGGGEGIAATKRNEKHQQLLQQQHQSLQPQTLSTPDATETKITDVEEFEALAEIAAAKNRDRANRMHHLHNHQPLINNTDAAGTTKETTGHCCFSGGCGRCASAAKETNYCSRSQDACERDCEFDWCEGDFFLSPHMNSNSSDSRDRSSSSSSSVASGVATAMKGSESSERGDGAIGLDRHSSETAVYLGGFDDLSTATTATNSAGGFLTWLLEPGRCCFFGDGCGASCGSFAEEGNFCAASRGHCEELCGIKANEFRWCPFGDDDAMAVAAKETRICDVDTAKASFTDLIIAGFD